MFPAALGQTHCGKGKVSVQRAADQVFDVGPVDQDHNRKRSLISHCSPLALRSTRSACKPDR
jgi:hypothetical protein